jgi:hypothetical protein
MDGYLNAILQRETEREKKNAHHDHKIKVEGTGRGCVRIGV